MQVLTLGGPGVTLVLALSFFILAGTNPQAAYLRYVGLSFVSASLGAAGQIVHLPSGVNLNAVITGAFYVGSALALSHGLLLRIGKKLDIYTTFGALVLIVGGLWYYSYIDYHLRIRIYILNFGCSLVLLRVVAGQTPLLVGKHTDKWLYWASFALAFSILFRTCLSLTPDIGVTSTYQFGWTRFWLVLQISMVLSAVILAVVLIVAVMSDRIDNLDKVSNHDALTGLLNRRGLEVYLALNRRRAADRPLSIVLIDVDHFKVINDTFGHSVGDSVLLTLAQVLKGELRRQDAAVRVGGEEFVALLPGTSNADAKAFAERLRTRIERAQFDNLPASHCITASMGVATRQDGELFSDLFDRADAMLYEAKSRGRNRVVANLDAVGN